MIKLDHLGYITAEMVREHCGDKLTEQFRQFTKGLANPNPVEISSIVGLCLLAKDDPAYPTPNLIVGSEDGFSWVIRPATSQ
jgi:hypothetical protein